MIYRLIAMTGPLTGQRITVDPSEMTIGRDAACAICIPDEEAASRHAVLEHRGEAVYLRDLGTIGGVLVNKREVREAQLRHGDVIEVGRTRFLVQAIVAAERAEEECRGRGATIGWLAAGVAAGVAVVAGIAYWLLAEVAQPGSGPARGGATVAASSAAPTGVVAVATPAATNSAPVASVVPAIESPATGVVAVAVAAPVEPPSTPADTDIVPEVAPVIVPVMPEAPFAGLDLPEAIPLDKHTPAAGAPIAAESPVSVEELRLMRADLAALRGIVEDLAMRDIAVLPSPAVTTIVQMVTSAPPALVSASPEDQVRQQNDRMLAEARRHAEAGRLSEADQILDSLQLLSPEYLAAYEERAGLYERRGLIRRAMDQWAMAMSRSTGTPFHDRAVAERLRLADLDRDAGNAPRKVVKLAAVEQQRFPGSEDYDEMRVLNISLQAEAPDEVIDPRSVSVEVAFFEQDGADRSRPVIARREPLQPEGRWSDDEVKTLTATYVVPSGQRARSAAEGRPAQYAGYVVSVFYDGVLQDEDARPRTLMELAPRAGAAVAGSAGPKARAGGTPANLP